MSPLEVVGFATGAASVWLFARQHMAAWPIGLLNSLAWLALFWGARLYLDAVLQVVYLGFGVAGWLWWRAGRTAGDDLPVTRTPLGEARALVALAVVAIAALWWFGAARTDAAQPFWDAATTVASLAAQYLLVRKRLSNWWVWIAVDVAYVGLYAAEHLYLTAALQPLFIGLCLVGIRRWSREPVPVPVPV